MLVALVVVLLTTYALIFPARTVEKELICGKTEHVHGEFCWIDVLTCTLEESDEHIHDEDCFTRLLICGMEEHVHDESCYAELLPETSAQPTQTPTEPAPSTEEPVTEPAVSDEPTEPAETEPAAEPAPTEPAPEDPAPAETQPADPAPAETGPKDPAPVETWPVDPEPAETEPVETEPAETEPSETEAPAPVFETEPEETDPNAPRRVFTKAFMRELSVLDAHLLGIEYPETGIDLAPYLDSAIFQHEVGGALVEETVFENGETAKAIIVYDIPRDIVTAENKYVYYQLPEGVRPIEETSGEVMDEGVAVGVYTITEDGMIHILFNDEFANGNAIVGTVEFTSWLYANDDGTDREVEFENDAGSITIIVPDEQKYDFQLEKTGDFNDNYTKANFVLTISSEKGTGAPITCIDLLTNQTPATLFSAIYEQTITVRHTDAEGNVTLIPDVNAVWDPDGMRFTVEALPALGPGERYELLYTVDLQPDLSASFELDNKATATTGTLEGETSFFLIYTCDIKKSGTFNPTTGLIDWVITVNPAGRPVAGWRIVDELPYPPVGPVVLTNANNVPYAYLTLKPVNTIDYTFPNNAPAATYYIRYSTETPTNPGKVRNTVHLYNDHDTEVFSEVEVAERAERVDKSHNSQISEPNGLVRSLWSFVATLPVGELESYSFRDNISSPIMDENTFEYLDNNLHFSYAAALEEAFRGNLRLISDGVEYRYGDEDNQYVNFQLTYYSAQGTVIDPTDTTTHVSRVVFDVTPVEGESFHGYQIVADSYPTWLDVSQAEDGAHWSYQNYIRLQGGASDASYASYRKSNVFRKQLLVGGRYSDDNGYLTYGDSHGVLEYRMLLDLTALVGEEFEVTDLLPAGTELVEDSPRVFFTSAALNGEYDGVFAEAGAGTFTVTQQPNSDGTTLVTFHGTGVTDLMKETYAYLGIVYRVRLTEDIWNDYTHTVAQYVNYASWDEYSDAHAVTVENFPKRIEKNGVQLNDVDGNPLSRVRFTLEINLGAEDLDPESDAITLTDVLNSNIAAQLELGSIRLYHYDPSKPDHIGTKVMPYEYDLRYYADTHTLEVVIPDETAYVMVYDYTVDNAAILDGETQIANQATLAGIFHSSSEVVLRGVSSSATAWQRVITVTKVDADNYSKVLPGAEFTLEYWDPALQVWLPVTDEEGQARTYVSNEAGKIVLSMLGTDKDLIYGTLYRMTEINAPVGYECDNTVMFFVCMPRIRDEEQDVFDEAAAGSGVEIDQVTFFDWNGGACVITNPFNGLTVDKRWFAYDGTEMDADDRDPITVRLYSSPDPTGETEPVLVPASERVENPVYLSPENDWTYTWEGLPTEDEEGNPIYYFVAEDPVPGFTPTYINNGITGGTIVITNDSEPYELPATGSIGSQVLVGVGAILMLLAAAVYIRFKIFIKEATK
jgi:LPXTG-motif cell wall-anchored protein